MLNYRQMASLVFWLSLNRSQRWNNLDPQLYLHNFHTKMLGVTGLSSCTCVSRGRGPPKSRKTMKICFHRLLPRVCQVYWSSTIKSLSHVKQTYLFNIYVTFLYQGHKSSHSTVYFICAMVRRSFQKAHSKASEATVWKRRAIHSRWRVV